MSGPERLLYRVASMSEDYDPNGTETGRHPVERIEEADVIASLASDGMHYPVLDLDFPARLTPSETPGHFHLAIDQAVEWDAYVAVLEALGAAGLLEPGYVTASIDRGASYVATRPWKHRKKEPAA